MRSNRLLALAALAGLSAMAGFPQSDPFAQNRRLGRGINIPGVFDLGGATVPEPPMKPEYFRKIKDAGFTNVRLVIRWSSYSQQEPPFGIDSGFLKKVDWAVDQSIAQGLAVVLDFHYYPLISFTGTQTSNEDPRKNRARFLALWQQISEHYRSSPPEVMFGVLNEPSRPNLGADGWNSLIAETIPLIRRANPNRTILIQTANGGGFGSIDDLRIPESERNAIVEVHYYDPGRFTHQQASWSSNRIRRAGGKLDGAVAQSVSAVRGRATQPDLTSSRRCIKNCISGESSGPPSQAAAGLRTERSLRSTHSD